MTFRDIVRAMLRLWYLCLVILAAAGCLAWTFDKNSGCYTTHTVVTFTRSAASRVQGGTNDPSVISFAGAIVDEINNGHSTPLYGWATAPIYGAGMRQGISVSLPNSAGQWSFAIATAEIDIQIVGPTEDWVQRQQRSVLANIAAATKAQPRATSTSGHIAARIEPLSNQIQHVQPSRSIRMMALAALGLAGVIAAGTISVLVDGLAGYVRARRRSRFDTPSLIGALS